MPRQCSILGCDRPHGARGWCFKHYQHWAKYGDPLYPTRAQRFWSKVEFTDSCWLWTAGIRNGYGQFKDGRMVNAHRWAYEFCVGPVPDGLQLDHLCRVRRCVYPWHLEPVTPRTNVLRGAGPVAAEDRQTHCIRGHEFNEENTYYRRLRRGRDCRACHRARWAEQKVVKEAGG